jgi:hypothetical protein
VDVLCVRRKLVWRVLQPDEVDINDTPRAKAQMDAVVTVSPDADEPVRPLPAESSVRRRMRASWGQELARGERPTPLRA